VSPLLQRAPSGLTLAALGAIGAALAAGGALWRALAPGPLPAAAQPLAVRDHAGPPRRPAYAADQVLAAIEKDPFQADRRRPAVRFRLPQEARPSRRPVADASASSAAVRVIGTAVLPDGGGFAICQRSGGSPTLVRLGGTLGDWTLKAVEAGQVTFVTASGATLVLRVLKPGGGS